MKPTRRTEWPAKEQRESKLGGEGESGFGSGSCRAPCPALTMAAVCQLGLPVTLEQLQWDWPTEALSVIEPLKGRPPLPSPATVINQTEEQHAPHGPHSGQRRPRACILRHGLSCGE